MPTTIKHRTFVLEPMGDKHVTDLPGVGTVTGYRLEYNGYDKVDFLIMLNFKKKTQSIIPHVHPSRLMLSLDSFC